MAAGDHRHAVAEARIEQPLSRCRRHGGGRECRDRRDRSRTAAVLEQHDRPPGALRERALQKQGLLVLFRLAASEQRRIDADQPPGADVATPAAGAVVTLPAGHAFGIDGLLQPDGERRLADVVVAGYGHPRRAQPILLQPGEGDIVLVAGPVEGDIAAVHDEIGRLALHLIDEHVPVVDEVGALAADVRVRHLHDADWSGSCIRRCSADSDRRPSWKVQRRGQIAHLLSRTWKRFESEARRDQLEDRGGIVGRACRCSPRLANGEMISAGMRVAGPQRSPQPEPVGGGT